LILESRKDAKWGYLQYLRYLWINALTQWAFLRLQIRPNIQDYSRTHDFSIDLK